MLRRELAALLLLSFAVVWCAEGGRFSDWTSLKVPPSLESLRASLGNSAAKVPIWKEVRSKIKPYTEPLERAVGRLIPRTSQTTRDVPEAVNSTSDDVTLLPMDQQRTPKIATFPNVTTFEPAGGAHSGEEVDDDRLIPPFSNGDGVLAMDIPKSPDSPDTPEISMVPEIPDIPDIVVSRERNDTIFRFRFQYRLRQAKPRNITAEP